MRKRAVIGVFAAVFVATPVMAADDVPVTAAPPVAPFRSGPLVEGDVGVYAPAGRIKNLVAPGTMVRFGLGWDIKKWLAFFGEFDAAFLSTSRAPPPPGERGLVLWGFGGGVRGSIPIGERVRVPIKLEIGAHKAADGGVLATYGYPDAQDFGVSFGATLGLEWRAISRHFGILVEGGVRNDKALAFPGSSQPPIAILGTLGVHYTL